MISYQVELISPVLGLELIDEGHLTLRIEHKSMSTSLQKYHNIAFMIIIHLGHIC